MGFGLLACGYLFFTSLILRTRGVPSLSFDVMPDLVAWLFLLLGARALSRWTGKFKVALGICIFMLPVSAFSFLYGLRILPEAAPLTFVYESVLPYLSDGVLLVFHFFLLFGIRDIALGCEGQEGLCKKLRRNFFITMVCLVLVTTARVALSYELSDSVRMLVVSLSYLAQMSYLVLNEIQLLSAFRRITLG